MDSKISQLPELTTVLGTEFILIASGGINRKVALSLVMSGITNPNVTLQALGLDQVDNTSDVDKPVSIAVVAALLGKADDIHSHVPSEVVGLDTLLLTKADVIALDAKADTAHQHTINDVINLQLTLDDKVNLAALAGKADTTHNHVIGDTTGLQTALDAKAAVSHGHAISNITSLQTVLDSKAPVVHIHQTSQIDTLDAQLASKAPLSHTHLASDIIGATGGAVPDFTLTVSLRANQTIDTVVNFSTTNGYYTPTLVIAGRYKLVTDTVWIPLPSAPFVDGTLTYTHLQSLTLQPGDYDVEAFLVDANNPTLSVVRTLVQTIQAA